MSVMENCRLVHSEINPTGDEQKEGVYADTLLKVAKTEVLGNLRDNVTPRSPLKRSDKKEGWNEKWINKTSMDSR